jgi:hypothetical protein
LIPPIISVITLLSSLWHSGFTPGNRDIQYPKRVSFKTTTYITQKIKADFNSHSSEGYINGLIEFHKHWAFFVLLIKDVNLSEFYATFVFPNAIFLCKIWGFHGGDNEKYRILGCYAAWFL